MLSTPVNISISQRQRPAVAASYEEKENECYGSASLASPTGVNDFVLLTASTEKCSNEGKEICDGGVVAKEGSIPTPFIDIDQNDGEVEVDLVDIDLTPVKQRAEITATTLQQPLKPEATTYDTPPSGGGCSPGCHALFDVACELDLLPDTDEKQRQQSTSDDDLFCKLKASETIAAAKANTPKMQTILDEIVELSMIVESPDEEERDDITSTVEGMLLSGMETIESWFGNACVCFHANQL